MANESIKQKFINIIKNNNLCKKSKRIDNLFTHLNETDELFSYKDFIRRDLHTPQYTFGKFFLQNEGIQKHICHVYFNKEIILNMSDIDIRRCIIFDIKIDKTIYCCYIESNYEDGCKSCHMGQVIDDFMYISHDIETLILYCLLPNALCFINI